MVYFFDMGGVLSSSSCTESICRELSISANDLYRFQINEYGANTYELLSVGSITADLYWENFSKNSKIEIKDDLFEILYKPILDLQVLSMIELLKNNGHKVICATNTIESHYKKHAELGNYASFDKVYSSHILGVKKPDPEFFIKILTSENIEPFDARFVDDDFRNIEAAAGIGISSHLYLSIDRLKNFLFMPPSLVIPPEIDLQ